MIFLLIPSLLFTFLSLSSFASDLLTHMSLEEKAGQVLLVHFNGEIANDEAAILINELYVGGIIYYNWANGLHSPAQVSDLSSSLQSLAAKNPIPIPLLIAVDQEGGRVARLTQGFTHSPSNQALGSTEDPERAQAYATIIGNELRAVGVNFNLAPVVDVNSNPRNPVIGDRSFGNSTDIVIPFATNALLGYQKAEILTSLKHFPGHGDVEIDSHQDLPSLNKSRELLEQVEFLPFAALCHQADTIMTAHLMVPSLDPINCATLSKSILDLLRIEMGFEGVIITDSLVMKGLLKNCASIEDAAIRALTAGCDLLTLGGKQLVGTHGDFELAVTHVKRIHQAIVNAVKAGQLSEERLNEAVSRILKLKGKYDIS